mmetsp:Transcript_32596/g.96988  ORF Transcript_32596/g.96988 Transcript_32596/m.96988 type:complete len:592 (-) Transcript_32596:103-1878(-)
MFTVQVGTLDGLTTAYECGAEDTALDLKVRVAADISLPSARVKLISGVTVLKNDAALAALAADGPARLYMVRDYERTAVGNVECLSSSAETWEEAVDNLLGELAGAGVEQGQVLWIDIHNIDPMSERLLSAHFSPHIAGRGPLRIGRMGRSANSWEELYAWADEASVGKEVISVSGTSCWIGKVWGIAKANLVLYLFYYVGETVPAAPVEHVCSAAETWNDAAIDVLVALHEAGVERGQLLGIDAHNERPDAAAVFAAHFCRGLQGYGRLALSMESCADEDAQWPLREDEWPLLEFKWPELERRIAERSAGRELVSTTGSSSCEGGIIMYAFWHVLDDPLELLIVETAPGTWRAAAGKLAARLGALGVGREQVVTVDAHNTGFGHPCVLIARYRRPDGGAPRAPPWRLALELRESEEEGWPYLRGWADGWAAGRDIVSITGTSGTLEIGCQGKSMLLFYCDSVAEGPGENRQSLVEVQSVGAAAGSWKGAADRLLAALSTANVERGHIIGITACNAGPDEDAEFQAHFSRARDGGGRPGRVAYECFNRKASWSAMHHVAGALVSGKDVISMTGSSNEKGWSMLYAFYWDEA